MRLALILAALLASGCTALDRVPVEHLRLAAWGSTGADLVTTQAAINSGLREGNPLLGTEMPVGFSGIASAALLSGAQLLEPYDERGAKWFYAAWTGYRTALAVHNLVLLLDNRPSHDNPAAIRRQRIRPTVGLRLSF